jgi:hypothetical protein
MNRWTWTVCLLALALSCGESALDTDTQDTTPPSQALSIDGTYETEGTWDLSGPLAGNQTVGDIAADLLIDQLVGMAGLPFGVGEDKVKEALSDLIREPVKDFVNANQPASLAEGGRINETLSLTLASVDVDTLLTLSQATDGETLSGTETIMSITVPYDGSDVEVPLDILVDDGETLVALSSDLTGKRTADDTVTLDEHTFQLRLNKLIEWVLTNAMGVDVDAIKDMLDCESLLKAIGADGGLTIDLPPIPSFSISSDKVTAACEAIQDKVAEKIIDKVSPDTGVIMSGSIAYSDTTGDSVVDTLASNTDYEGSYTSLPGPIDPVIVVTFTGARVDEAPRPE